MTTTPRRGVFGRAVLALAAVAVLVVAGCSSDYSSSDDAAPVAAVETTTSHGAAASSDSADQLRADMRKLWEDHITWTRLYIVSAVAGLPDTDATAGRLLQNQADLGDAIKPFYGEAAGDQLTALLRDHITIAVEVLQAAKAGDDAAFAEANTRWYANSDDIADFLASANPRFWPQDVMRADMRTHLDQTLAEAAHELAGDYPASIADYEQVHAHILAMADLLSAGIIGQRCGAGRRKALSPRERSPSPTVMPASREVAAAISCTRARPRGVSIIAHSRSAAGAPWAARSASASRTASGVSVFGSTTPWSGTRASAARSSFPHGVSRRFTVTSSSCCPKPPPPPLPPPRPAFRSAGCAWPTAWRWHTSKRAAATPRWCSSTAATAARRSGRRRSTRSGARTAWWRWTWPAMATPAPTARAGRCRRWAPTWPRWPTI